LYCTEVAPTRLRVPMAGISTAVSSNYLAFPCKRKVTNMFE
jgi:hypothetical protein